MAKYSDIQLIQIIQKAGRRINRKLCLTGTSNEVVVDGGGEIVAPTGNPDLQDIVLMQAECMVASREYQDDLRDAGGIVIRDGEQTVDTSKTGIARGTFYSSEFSPCAELKMCIRDMKLRGIEPGSGGPGKLVW